MGPLLAIALAATVGDGRLHLHVLDVGLGSATLIRAPTGRTVLLDAGSVEARPKLLARLDQLLPKGGPLDLIVLSSPSPLRAGGVESAAKRYRAQRFLDGGWRPAPLGLRPMLEALVRAQVPVLTPSTSPESPDALVRIGLGGGAELEVRWPRAPAEPTVGKMDPLVARIRYGDTSVLLMGDASEAVERELVGQKDVASTVLVVGAHGAAEATSLPWAAVVRPLAAVVSVGPGSGTTLPSREVLERLQRVGARTFRTDLDGEVHLESDGEQLWVELEQVPPGMRKEPVAIGPKPPVLASVDAPPSPPRKKRTRPLPPPKGPAPKLTLDSKPPPFSAAAYGLVAPGSTDGGVTQVVVVPGKKGGPKVVAPGGTGPVEPTRPTVAPAQPEVSAGDGTDVFGVFVSKKGSREFHKQTCPEAAKIPVGEMVVFTSRRQAAAKLKPAADCRP